MNGIRQWAKIACLLLVAALSCGSFYLSGSAENTADPDVPSQEDAQAAGGALYGKTDSLELYLNEQEMTFFVKNLANGYVWHSNPPLRAQDSYSFGINKMEMSSLLTIDYIRKSTGNADKINSYTGSVTDGNYKVTKIKNGFRVDFRLEEISLTLPLEIQLTPEGLMARVLTSRMVQDDKDVFVETISVLPYFGAGPVEEEGYLLLPDGCGALVYFDNGKYSGAGYSMPVYGADPADYSENPDLNLSSRKISLPVYGIKRPENACLAVLQDGAELADLRANAGRQITGYANAYAEYHIYGKMKYTLAKNDAMIYEKENKNLTDLSLSVLFLTGADANYSGMARAYRGHLQKRQILPDSGIQQQAAYVTLHGAVMKKVSRLGFVAETPVPLTTIKEIGLICDELRRRGVDNLVVDYRSWNKQELSGKQVTKPAMGRGLGSFKDLNKLQGENQTVYATLSNVLQYQKLSFFGRFTSTVSDISGMALRLSRYSVGLGLPLSDQRYYLLTTGKVAQRAQALSKGMDKKALRYIGLDDMAGLLYNDYRADSAKRNDTRAQLEKGLRSMRDAAEKLLFDNPNQYALPFATEIVGLPTESSGHHLIDEDVPFEQLVLSGSLRYAADAMNFTDAEKGLLKALETGSMLHYEGYYRETSSVKKTQLSHLCNGSADLFSDQLATQYKALKAARKAVSDSALHEHRRIAANVYAAVYENGVTILVNYGDTDHLLENGSSVPAGGYLIEQGAE